ncbi:DUF4423 domain-containing protein [bacterium]|nr:DUF4423 domain-containing protein [bacterium]
MQTVFESASALEYLKSQTKYHKGVYRYKSQLAEAAGCQLSYLSQILSGKVNLNPDQAAGLSSFWNHSSLETDYFIELVYLDRAGTPRLRSLIQRRLEIIKLEAGKLSAKITQLESAVPPTALYYSTWYYAAAHILLSIPGYSDGRKIAERLGITAEQANQALLILEDLGFAKRGKAGWSIDNINVHIPRESPLHETNHTHWRLKSIEGVQKKRDVLSYTGLHSLSRADVETVRLLAADFLSRARKTMQTSPEEDLICLNCDLFVL